MRETFGSLILSAQDLISDPSDASSTDLSTTKTFLKREINNGLTTCYNKLRIHKVQRTQTASTVADQQFYHKPPDWNAIESATHTVGDIAYPLVVMESQHRWDVQNQIDFSGTIIPRFIFPRRDDFGIWPTPTTSGETITITYNYILKDMAADDESGGTVAVTNNSQTVTGTSTAFTAAMVGRWFKADDDGDWYRVSAFGSTTSITLESAFEGSTDTSTNYVIGESPEIPVEVQEYVPHYAAATFFMGPRRDLSVGAAHLNYFWTGDPGNGSRKPSNAAAGLLGAVSRYNLLGRSNTQLVGKKKQVLSRFDEAFTTTLS